MKKERQLPDGNLWVSDGGPVELEIFNGGYNRYVNEELDNYYFKVKITPDLVDLMNVDTVEQVEAFLKRI